MKIYKIRHKPTGLYYKPSVHPYHHNLSKNGKVYHRKPNIESYLNHCGCLSYYHPLKTKDWNDPTYERRNTILEDWEIIEGEI